MKAKLVQNSEVVTPGLKTPLLKGEVSGAALQQVCFSLIHNLKENIFVLSFVLVIRNNSMLDKPNQKLSWYSI